MPEEGFNPYRKWLGIPESELPANYYRLLGVELFEEDLDVIDNAAHRQMAHIRTFQRSQHADASQQLLNELSAAKKTLLSPTKRVEYDGALRSQLGQPQANPKPPAIATPVTPVATPVAPIPPQHAPPPVSQPPAVESFQPKIRRVSAGRRSKSSTWPMILVIVGLIVLLVGGGIAALVVVGGAFFLVKSPSTSRQIELLPTPSDSPTQVVVVDGADSPDVLEADEPSADVLTAIEESRTAALRNDVAETNAAMKRASRSAKTATEKEQVKANSTLLKAVIRFTGYAKQGASRQAGKPPFQFRSRFYQVFSYEDGVIRYSVAGGLNEKPIGELPPADSLALVATVSPLNSDSLAAGAAAYLLLNGESDDSLRSIGAALHSASAEAPSHAALQAEIDRRGWDLNPETAIPAVELQEGELPPIGVPGLKIPGAETGDPAEMPAKPSVEPMENDEP